VAINFFPKSEETRSPRMASEQRTQLEAQVAVF